MYDSGVWHRCDDLRLARLATNQNEPWKSPTQIWLFAGVQRLVDGPRVLYRYVMCPDPRVALTQLETRYPGTGWVAWMHVERAWGYFAEWHPVPMLSAEDLVLLSEKLSLPARPTKPQHPGRKGNRSESERKREWRAWLDWHLVYEPGAVKAIERARRELDGA